MDPRVANDASRSWMRDVSGMFRALQPSEALDPGPFLPAPRLYFSKAELKQPARLLGRVPGVAR